MINQISTLAAELAKEIQNELAELKSFTSRKQNPALSADKISSFLLNAWSAEYALRIAPVMQDDVYLTQASGWVFPQVYYSCFFSSRAFAYTVLRPHDFACIISERDLLNKINMLKGYYPDCLFEDGPARCSFMETLLLFRLTDEAGVNDLRNRLKKLTKDQFLSLHQSLITVVSQINLVHEAHIMRGIGIDTYGKIVNAMPDYLQKSFISERLYKLMALEAELQIA